jgi:hypothetical protein
MFGLAGNPRNRRYFCIVMGQRDIQHTELRASHCKPAEALINFSPQKLNVVPSGLL